MVWIGLRASSIKPIKMAWGQGWHWHFSLHTTKRENLAKLEAGSYGQGAGRVAGVCLLVMDEVYLKLQNSWPEQSPLVHPNTQLAHLEKSGKDNSFWGPHQPAPLSGEKGMMGLIWNGLWSINRSSPGEQGRNSVGWHQWIERNVQLFSGDLQENHFQVHQFSWSLGLTRARCTSTTENNVRERASPTTRSYTNWGIAQPSLLFVVGTKWVKMCEDVL